MDDFSDVFKKVEAELRAKATESIAGLTDEKTKLISELHLLTAKKDFLDNQIFRLTDRTDDIIQSNNNLEAEGQAELRRLERQAELVASDFADRQTTHLKIESDWRRTLSNYEKQQSDSLGRLHETEALIAAAEDQLAALKHQQDDLNALLDDRRDQLHQLDDELRIKRDATEQTKLVLDIEAKAAKQTLDKLHDSIGEAKDDKAEALQELEVETRKLNAAKDKQVEFIKYQQETIKALQGREAALDDRITDFERREIQSRRRTVV